MRSLPSPQAEIDDAARPGLPERLPHRGEAPLVEADRTLETLLLPLMLRFRAGARVLLGHELLQGRARQVALVLEVSGGRSAPARVRGEPALSPGQQLVQLLLGRPSSACRRRAREAARTGARAGRGGRQVAASRTPVVGALPPLGEAFVEGQAAGPRRRTPAARRGGAGRARRPRQGSTATSASRGIGVSASCRPVPAAALESGAEDAGQGDAEEGRRHVGAVVDVLPQGAAVAGVGAPGAAHETDRIEIQQQRRLAAVLAGLGVEDVGLSEGQGEGLAAGGVLDQQVAEVGSPAARVVAIVSSIGQALPQGVDEISCCDIIKE